MHTKVYILFTLINIHSNRSCKGGIAKATTYWELNSKTPPCSLPNKDNEAAARLGNDAEKERVAKSTSRGDL